MPKNLGFTITELLVIIGILGVMVIVALPRLQTQVFDERGFHDQTLAALRYAQKAAIAQRRNVCAAFTASSITLTIASASGDAAPCDTPLAKPSGGNFTLNAPTGVTFSGVPGNFSFSALGRPSAGQTLQVSNVTDNITVEAETGYVH